jgi:hypothetical protein
MKKTGKKCIGCDDDIYEHERYRLQPAPKKYLHEGCEPKHEPNLAQIKIGFESEENQEQVYVTTNCTCGDKKCSWSVGAILRRYQEE